MYVCMYVYMKGYIQDTPKRRVTSRHVTPYHHIQRTCTYVCHITSDKLSRLSRLSIYNYIATTNFLEQF